METKNMYTISERSIDTIVVGSGAAGLSAACRLHEFGHKDLAIVTENLNAGTSRNTGSDKQTYYKLSLAGNEPDSVMTLAEDLFAGQCVDGDMALCEAALSARGFYYLVELGVPFPHNEYGEYIGYKTDHDRGKRATSAGPYTSKHMTECLEKRAKDLGIAILNDLQVIKILKYDDRVTGVLCLHRGQELAYEIIWSNNVILATGGPASIYHDSVYPASQLGSSGIAFEAGIKGKNLTEWQYGMASLNPRWNVSGSYMQVLPTFISTDADGEDEREFLLDYFADSNEMLGLVFMKGYQWPFDVKKVFGGSSVIDLLIYQETILKKRRVYLDFRSNSQNTDIEFTNLADEAYAYLNSVDACFGTPIDRLAKMNEPAISFYQDHGIDLYRDRLEIAICAQHNNGGLATDSHWQSDIKGVFAIGEVCGSHGVTRPGGSALNAGQVGALRAARYITANDGAVTESDKKLCREEANESISSFLYALQSNPHPAKPTLSDLWLKYTKRMSRCGGMIRNRHEIAELLDEVTDLLANYQDAVSVNDSKKAAAYYRLYDLLLAQKVYLAAMLDYIDHGGKSRGSALYTNETGESPGVKNAKYALDILFNCSPDDGRLSASIQEISYDRQQCKSHWRPVRPIPDPNNIFEIEWAKYREKYLL